MDEVDLKILLSLMDDCRKPQREIARELDLSVTAVNKRVTSLTGEVIRDFIGGLHFAALPSSIILIYGNSAEPLDEDSCHELGKNRLVRRVSIASGNLVYVIAHLEEIHQMDELADFVAKIGHVEDPQIGIVNHHIPKHYASSLDGGRLVSLDYRIIKALKSDARRSVTELADELGSTAKTIRRRLKKLVESNSIRLTIDLRCTGELFAMYHIILKDVDKKPLLVHRLINHYRPHVFEVASFSNKRKQLFCQAWGRNLQEITEIQNRIAKEDGVKSVVPNIFINGFNYETWRDEHVARHSKARGASDPPPDETT